MNTAKAIKNVFEKMLLLVAIILEHVLVKIRNYLNEDMRCKKCGRLGIKEKIYKSYDLEIVETRKFKICRHCNEVVYLGLETTKRR